VFVKLTEEGRDLTAHEANRDARRLFEQGYYPFGSGGAGWGFSGGAGETESPRERHGGGAGRKEVLSRQARYPPLKDWTQVYPLTRMYRSRVVDMELNEARERDPAKTHQLAQRRYLPWSAHIRLVDIVETYWSYFDKVFKADNRDFIYEEIFFCHDYGMGWEPTVATTKVFPSFESEGGLLLKVPRAKPDAQEEKSETPLNATQAAEQAAAFAKDGLTRDPNFSDRGHDFLQSDEDFDYYKHKYANSCTWKHTAPIQSEGFKENVHNVFSSLIGRMVRMNGNTLLMDLRPEVGGYAYFYSCLHTDHPLDIFGSIPGNVLFSRYCPPKHVWGAASVVSGYAICPERGACL
jgi:hypothetical protein